MYFLNKKCLKFWFTEKEYKCMLLQLLVICFSWIGRAGLAVLRKNEGHQFRKIMQEKLVGYTPEFVDEQIKELEAKDRNTKKHR